jgi:glycosyltransferase involved in cell wall biosynthesis
VTETVEKTEDIPELSLVIPCYNEEDVIANTAAHLIEAFRAMDVDLELVLVDNGSVDGTGKIIDGLIADGCPVVKATVTVNQGYGNGVLCGIEASRGKFIGFTCADGQVEADDVAKAYRMASQMKEDKLVKVRRRFRMDGLVRKCVSVFYNILITVMFGGLGSIDINGNPKIVKREYVERMKLKSKDWFIDAEMMIKAKKLGLGVFEFNVLSQMREGGSSNVNAGTCWEFIVNLLKYRFGKAGRIETEQK